VPECPAYKPNPNPTAPTNPTLLGLTLFGRLVKKIQRFLVRRRTDLRGGVGDVVSAASHRVVGDELQPSRTGVEEDRIRPIRATQSSDRHVALSSAVDLQAHNQSNQIRLVQVSVFLSARISTNFT